MQSTRIVGGEPATRGEFKGQVGRALPSASNEDENYFILNVPRFRFKIDIGRMCVAAQ